MATRGSGFARECLIGLGRGSGVGHLGSDVWGRTSGVGRRTSDVGRRTL